MLLDGITFAVHCGQILGLLGVNGAGKSTTLKISGGILLPDTGKVAYASATRIGFVPEQPPLWKHWRVKHFLLHACALHRLPKAAHLPAVERVTALCELQAIFHQPCHTLSKGNQQRVNIAQALLNQPNLLILDEPTSGLDPRQIAQFRRLLKNIQPETAILLSSHIMQEVTALCDRVVIIHEGKQLQTIDLNLYEKKFIVEFSEAVAAEQFASCEAWQAGSGKQHHFYAKDAIKQQAVWSFCLEKGLPVHRVLGVEQALENEFLACIEPSIEKII